MVHSASDVEVRFEQLAGIKPFVVAVDERLTVMWASEPVLRRRGDVVGLKLSDLIEPVEPQEEPTPLSIARNRGARHEVLLKNGALSTPLIGEWVLFRGGFIFLAGPDVRRREDLDKFFFDDFSEDDHTIELLTAREEHIRSLREAKSAVDALREKNEIIEESNQRLGFANAELEKEITERKRAARKLEELHDIINKSPAVVFLWRNVEGWPVEHVSENVKDLFGYTAEEFMSGKVSYAETVHPDDLEGVGAEVSAYSKEEGRDEFTQEYRIITKDGKVEWTDDRTLIRRNEKGEITHYQGVVLGISERKRAEEALRQKEERLKLALQGGDLGTWDWNTRTDKVQFDERWAGMKGYSLEEIEPCLSSWESLVHPEDMPGVREKLNAHFEGKIPFYEAEFRMRHKFGEWLWILDKGKVIERDEDGKPMRVCGTHLDITERKRTEEALRESEARYRGIIENMQDVFYRVDPRGLLTLVSPSSVTLFGYESVEDIIGRDILEFYAHSGDRADFLKALKQSGGRIVNYEVMLKRKDGGTFPVIVSSAYCRDENGEIIGVEGVFSDITERKRAEKNLVRAKEAAEDANRVKSEFLANMSHEIRTPLNGVMGMLQLALETGLTKEQREYLETSLTSSRSLLKVINDILDISQIEAGKMEIVLEEFNLPEILRTVTETFMPQAKAKSIKLEYCIDEKMPRLFMGDGGRIRQILFNLIGNSMKFTERGEVRVQVSALWPKQGVGDFRLLFSVSDTGIGIPDDKIEYIFEPFTQVDGSYKRGFQGTGLGLGIVKRLVTRMGGTISVSSEQGVGTSVYFSVETKVLEHSHERRLTGPGRRRVDMAGLGRVVPFVHSSEDRELFFERRTRSPGRRETDIQSVRFKILVAEDNPVNRMFAVKILEKMGHGVAAVENGREVLSVLAREHFDLVFLDVQMPVMDGVEATRAIRGSMSGNIDPHIPLIAMTAHAMKGDREKFLEIGMDDYIAKPVESRELAKAIKRAMRSKIRSSVTKSA